MGNCVHPAAAYVAPPKAKNTKQLSFGEVYNIVKTKTKCDQIILWDTVYSTINDEDVKTFLKFNINDPYVAEKHDCDDFSFILCGRFREYMFKSKITGGPIFGILAGNLKKSASDPDRGHAVCFYINENLEFKIVDGMYNSIEEVFPSMDIWTVIV